MNKLRFHNDHTLAPAWCWSQALLVPASATWGLSLPICLMGAFICLMGGLGPPVKEHSPCPGNSRVPRLLAEVGGGPLLQWACGICHKPLPRVDDRKQAQRGALQQVSRPRGDPLLPATWAS